MKSDRRSFLGTMAVGVCTPLLGAATASCTGRPGSPASPQRHTSGASEVAPASATSAEPAGTHSPAEEPDLPRRRFGRHDVQLSVVGLGGHTLKLSSSQAEADRIVSCAIDRGINFFDNAWDYHDGEAERVMGQALAGHDRDSLFLMSKFCIFHSDRYSTDRAGAMKMLEDSLRRLGTDHLDLWMLHNVKGDDARRADQEGAIEALELAKKQGKIRFTGFTGHTDPQIHVDLIKGGHPWDATLMPVSALGALSGRQFEQVVMPLCEQKNIAVLGMKGFGGSKRAYLHGKTNVTEVVRYSLSYPQVCTHLIGIDKLEYVDQAVQAAKQAPMTPSERQAHARLMKACGGESYAMYLNPSYERCYSRGGVHPSQLG